MIIIIIIIIIIMIIIETMLIVSQLHSNKNRDTSYCIISAFRLLQLSNVKN
jgi:hypothetical protein